MPEAPEAIVTVDGVQVGCMVHADSADAALASQLASVWIAWTSCEVWDFESQRRWIADRVAANRRYTV